MTWASRACALRFSVWEIGALGPAPGVPLIELWHVSCYRPPPFLLHAVAVSLFSGQSPRARVQSPKARHQRPPYLHRPDNCGVSSSHYRPFTQLLLPLGHRQRVIDLSTISRLSPRLSLPSLFPSIARLCWLCFGHPV